MYRPWHLRLMVLLGIERLWTYPWSPFSFKAVKSEYRDAGSGKGGTEGTVYSKDATLILTSSNRTTVISME